MKITHLQLIRAIHSKSRPIGLPRSVLANRLVSSFKKTKSMSALLEERSKRHHGREEVPGSVSKAKEQNSLGSLVESVKRKSHMTGESHAGKRRKLAPK